MSYDFEEASSQRITYATVHADYTSQMSISFWFKAESLPGAHQMHFVDKGKNDAGNNRNFSMYWTPAGGGQYGVSWDNPAGSYHEWSRTATLPTGVWTHWYCEIDWSVNPDSPLLWFNGVSQALTNTFGTNNADPLTTATQHISIGGEHGTGGNYYDGLLAEVAIWSDRIGSSRGTTLYNSGFGGRADIMFPNNLQEYMPLRVDADNDKGGSGSVTGATLSSDHPFPDGGGIITGLSSVTGVSTMVI